MTLQSNIVIVGAGPIGLITACMIKATNAAAGITIVEKRPAPTRNHGLKINADSVKKITDMLEVALKQANPIGNISHIETLIRIFSGWSNHFIRTSEIERLLSEVALSMEIRVLTGPQYEIKAEKFDALFQEKATEEDVNVELRQIFRQASLIIGADGAHSAVRQAVMKNELADDEILRHLIEFKFQSSSHTQPRSYMESSLITVKEGKLNFETMSANTLGETKPVTVHIFVDKSTYDGFRVQDEAGNMKGIYGNSWTLQELQDTKNPRVRDICQQFNRYLEQLTDRGGFCINEQISTLQMRVYRSIRCAQRHDSGKYVLLVGDAESGLVLERGFNKGLKGVAICSQVINAMNQDNIEEQFGLYEQQMQAIFQSEKSLAIMKNKALKVAESSLFASQSLASFCEKSTSSCVIC